MICLKQLEIVVMSIDNLRRQQVDSYTCSQTADISLEEIRGQLLVELHQMVIKHHINLLIKEKLI
jgi:hypothetical protein